MVENEDYKLYINERFASLTTLINAHHEQTQDKLHDIEEHVKITNGRVSCLEKEHHDRGETLREFKELQTRIGFLKKRWIVILGGLIIIILVVNFLWDVGIIKQLFMKWIST